MFQFVRRNLKQLMDLRARATRQLGPQCRSDMEVWGFLAQLDRDKKVRGFRWKKCVNFGIWV